ncbi:MAG: hypothetical protein GY795_45550 [Desulfobacterales bacterium]|nr:hypothetical protein [Desulfobacterales bacterium]
MLKPYYDEIQQLALVYAHCGLKPDNGNRVYSVAAAIIDTDKPKKEFSSLVRYSFFTGREKYYSNTSKEKLNKAPLPKDVIEKLRKFLKGHKFVFAFDNHDCIDELKKYCGSLRIADLSFASEFFLPHLESHTPRRIWEHISGKQRKTVSFSAAEIVDLSVGLLQYICANQLNDRMNPRASAIRYFLKQSNTLFGEAFIHVAQNNKKYFGGLFDSCTVSDVAKWKMFLETADKPSRKKNKDRPDKRISYDNLENLYRKMSESGKGFKFREEQVVYARHVADALNDSDVLTIEAGTGTGKTQGYLIPVMEFLRLNKDARVVISTYTKNLQEQIFQRELPVASPLLKPYQDIPVAILKGKSSYICTEKLDHVYEDSMTGEKLLTWLYFVNIIYHFRNADTDSLGEKIKFYLNRDLYLSQMLNEISAKDGCTPKHKLCPAQVVTAEASSARLVITNHHKLVLLDQDSVLSGLFKNYIIDEANHFENAVRGALREEVSSWEIAGITRFLEPALRRILKRAAGDYEKDIKRSLEAIDTLRSLIYELRQSLFRLNPRISLGQVSELQHEHPGFKNGYIREHVISLQNALGEISENLKFIKDADACRMLRIQPRTAERIKIAARQSDDCAATLGTIEKSIVLEDKVSAYQCFSQNWSLSTQSVDVAGLIQHSIFEEKSCVVFTAATLCHKGSFDSFRNITGMNTSDPGENEAEQREFRFKTIPSPFSKDAIEIIVPNNAANGKYDNKEAWISSVSAIIPELVKKNKGRTLVLFSSYSDLNLIVKMVADSLTAYPLLIQQQGSSTISLCEEFRDIKESVLFGVDTFWYGVDFKGDTLTQVIITRIPYPASFDPIQMARKKIMSSNDYWKRYRYDTDIKLKQGIGRLIRSETDRGRVVILDSRFRWHE